MTRRPHMTLRVGEVNLIIGYEQRGTEWVVYRTNEGEAPSFDQQAQFTNRIKAHEAWLETCHRALSIIEEKQAAPEREKEAGIQHFFDDLQGVMK